MGNKAPAELHERDWLPIALRRDDMDRNEARYRLAHIHDLEYAEARVRATHYRVDTDYAEEAQADGIEEPYDGWPWVECKPDAPGAVAYWTLNEECR